MEMEEEEYIVPAIAFYIPERAELAETFVNQLLGLNEKKLLQLRMRSAKLITALNYKRETVKRRRIRQKL